jgi:hypothetical protein
MYVFTYKIFVLEHYLSNLQILRKREKLKPIKWAVLIISIIFIAWYTIDFIRYSDYAETKKIEDVNGDTLVLTELKILPDASYMPLEVKMTDQTQVTGLGPLSLFFKNKNDLKHGQKVRVWYNNENTVGKVVVYNLFYPQ